MCAPTGTLAIRDIVRHSRRHISLDSRARDRGVCAVGPQEQIADGAAEEVGDPPLLEVVRPVVDEVTALAEAAQVAQPVVARIVIEVGGGKDDPCRPLSRQLLQVRPAAGSNQRPSGRQRTVVPCRRPHPWQMPPARSKRTRRLSWGQ